MERRDNPIPAQGSDLLATVVGGVLRRLGGESSVRLEPGRPATSMIGDARRGTLAQVFDEPLLTPAAPIVDAIKRTGGAIRQSAVVSAIECTESTVGRKPSEPRVTRVGGAVPGRPLEAR